MNKVSILMPVFNEQKYVEESIQSVLIQSYDNFELIIVDDYSTDDSYSLLEKYSLIDNRIKLIKNIEKGKNSAFNLAFKESSGDFICYFAGDDIMDVDSISNRISKILNSNSLIASASKVRTISSISKFSNVIIPKKKNKGTLVGGAVMFNRDLANKIFPIPEQLPNEDRWTELHINFFADIIHVPIISLLYRIHSDNSSSRTCSFEKKNIDMHKRFLVFKLFLDKYEEILSDLDKKYLNSMIVSEDLRYNNKTLSLLFIPNLSIKEKIRFIFHSNKMLYSIRINFFSFFSGWG